MNSTMTESQIAESENADLTVADAVWVGTALLHNDHGGGPFTTEDIVQSVQDHHLTKGTYKSIWQHVNQHCVANRKPQPNRARMLFATGTGNRRLFRQGDRFDPERAEGRTHPEWSKLPPQYAYLSRWFETVWNKPDQPSQIEDPLLMLAGTGTGLWGGGSVDEYVNSLRTDWETSR